MISVILPVYNRESYIEECIQSVLAQSYQNFEIVIVDDGSTDSTYEICKDLASKDSRIRLLSITHCGVSAARNTALDAAAGEFAFFLDSDDVIHPKLLEALVLKMKETGAAMGGTNVARATEPYWHLVREQLKETSAAGITTLLSNEEALAAMFSPPSPFSCIGGVMIRRDLIEDTKFRTDLYIGEDFFFIYENLIKGAACVFLKQKWYYVRNHNRNLSWDYSFSGFWSRFYRRKLVWESEEAFGRIEYADKQRRNAYSCFILCLRKNKPTSKDSKEMRQVMRQYKKELLPALPCRAKIMFLLLLYLPLAASPLLLRLKDKLK